MNPKTLSLVIYHDQRNENFLLADKLPKPKGVTARGAAEFKPKTRSHRQYRWFTQNGPSCTGWSPITLMAAAHPFNKIPLVEELIRGELTQRAFTGDDWYRLNQLFDRKHGRHFSAGATVTASMEIGRALGIFSEYRWAYTMRVMQQANEIAPLIAGTYWYPSMFERDAEGIVRSPAPHASAGDLGHQYVLNKYDAKRDLWRVPNTWGDGYYFIPGDLMYRLVREEGEIAQITEVKVPKVIRLADVEARLAA